MTTPKDQWKEVERWEKILRDNTWDSPKGLMTKVTIYHGKVKKGWEAGHFPTPVTLDMVIEKMKVILHSELEKVRQETIKECYELACTYPEANVQQLRLDIKRLLDKHKRL